MRKSVWIGILLVVSLIMHGGFQHAFSCDPEPGPHHFQKLEIKISPPPPPLLSGFFEVFSVSNGLPCDNIRALLCQGPVVFAGSDGGGLMMFRGGSWQAFNPSSNPPFPAGTVNSIVAGPEEGTVYAGTPAGVVRIKGFLEGQPLFELLPLSGTKSRNFLSLCQGKNALLAGSDCEGGRIAGNAFLPIPPAGESLFTGFGSVAIWKEAILFGTSLGLLQETGNSLVPLRFPDVELGWVQALFPATGTLYLGANSGCYRMDANASQPVELLPGIWTTSIAGTPGLATYDFPPGDESDLLGFGLRRAGLGSETMNQLASMGNNLEKQIQDLEPLRLWLTNPANFQKPDFSQKGWYFLEKTGEILAKAFQVDNTFVNPLTALIKGLWIGTQNAGVVFFAEDGIRRNFTSENSKLPSNSVTAIACRESGETWIGTAQAGILRYRALEVPESRQVWAGAAKVLRAFGPLFIGTSDQGLLVMNPTSFEIEGQYNPSTVKGFHRSVTAVEKDGLGRLWVGGDKGVWMLDDRGWHSFGMKEGLPSEKVQAMAARDTRVYAAVEGEGPICARVAYFNGISFVAYSAENLDAIFQMSPASASEALEALGLLNTYGRSFDVKNAPAGIAKYRNATSTRQITAMLDTPPYLLIGSNEGLLVIFDGENFKPLSDKGTGSLGGLAGFGRRGNGDLLLTGRDRILTFDGKKFTQIPNLPCSANPTSFSMDDMNPDAFWIGYESQSQGGIALFQGTSWKMLPQPKPVKAIAVSFPNVFFATPQGVEVSQGK